MNRYSVRIILDELDIYAESEDRANEIAQDIMDGDAGTHLLHNFSVIGYDTEIIEENTDEDETEIL